MSSLPAFCAAVGFPQSNHRIRDVRNVRSRLPIIAAAHPPRRIAAVAKDLQDALQRSLQSRVSRIGVRLPTGARLGMEKRPDGDAESLDVRRLAGDRELARVLLAMFEGTGLNALVAFASESECESAVKLWGPSVSSSVEAWSSSSERKARVRRSSKSMRKSKGGSQGFGSTPQNEDLKNPDVYIAVGGGAGFLAKVCSLARSVGMDKLVIVANGNSREDQLPLDVKRYFEEEFETVYYYQPNPHPKWSGGVLFRKFPDGTFIICPKL